MELLKQANGSQQRSPQEKQQMIEDATIAYGNFLTSLGFDWKSDDHSKDTPRRVAKAWVNDIIAGSVNDMSEVTAFPNTEGFTGLVCQTQIDVVSLCAHHNLPFIGVAHVGYIPGDKKGDLIVGLSKLNRIVDWYSRRPNIQESLTKQIHDKVDELCKGNRGVAVVVESQHNCVRCRGIRHDSVMKTSQLSGLFYDNEIGTRQEFFNLIYSK